MDRQYSHCFSFFLSFYFIIIIIIDRFCILLAPFLSFFLSSSVLSIFLYTIGWFHSSLCPSFLLLIYFSFLKSPLHSFSHTVRLILSFFYCCILLPSVRPSCYSSLMPRPPAFILFLSFIVAFFFILYYWYLFLPSSLLFSSFPYTLSVPSFLLFISKKECSPFTLFRLLFPSFRKKVNFLLRLLFVSVFPCLTH